MAFRDKSDLSVLLPACLLGRILKNRLTSQTRFVNSTAVRLFAEFAGPRRATDERGRVCQFRVP